MEMIGTISVSQDMNFQEAQGTNKALSKFVFAFWLQSHLISEPLRIKAIIKQGGAKLIPSREHQLAHNWQEPSPTPPFLFLSIPVYKISLIFLPL